MRIASIACFVIGTLLAIGGFINASKPSVSPIVTVIGSFALPAIFIWWGVILHKRANRKKGRP
jgi:hypothetical protein